MKLKNILIILIGIAFLSIPVNAADSGTLTIENSAVHAYSTSGLTSGAASIDFNNFRIDATDYDILYSFDLNLSGIENFPAESSSTTFTCTSGCTGSGTVSYTKSTGKVYWLTGASAITISNSNITFSYGAPIFTGFTDVNVLVRNDLETVSSTQPIKIESTGGSIMSKNPTNGRVFDYDSFTALQVSNSYSVTYSTNVLGQIIFNTSIDKSGTSVPTRITLKNQTNVNYSTESTLTTTSFNVLNTLTTGIYIRAETQSGSFTEATINTSGAPSPPGAAGTNPTNLTKPSTGGIVVFDKSSYFVGDNVNISWYFSDNTWNNFNGKRLYLLLNGNPISESLGCGSIDCIEISTQSGYYIFQATQLGTLQAILREGIFFYSDVLGGSASVQILPPGNSWIALNKTIAFAKNPVNVTYHIGYSVASYPAAVIEIDTIDIATGNTVDSVFPTVFPDGVINIGVIHPLPKGNYSIKLYDAVKNVYLDTKYLTMIVPNVQIPGQGITVSNISTDKNLYFYNDWMTVNFAVDDTNFSNYNYTLMMHVIALDRLGIVTKMIISPMQDQVGTFTTLVNIDKNTKCEQKLNCWFETGNNSINIVLMNSTASVTIAYANFTVSSTTVDGYGLQLSTTTPQSNTQFTITTTVPTLHTGRLRIVTAGSGNISAIPDQTVNAGISTLPATISIVNNFDKAYYNVELYGDDGILKVRIPITVTQQVKPLTTSEINAMDKIDSWTALFGLGVNPTSKFIFGMMITLLIAACGVILVKNDRFIGAALFGAIPFLFFSYISYFPIVVPVIVGIIIALKFRFL